MKKFIVLSLVLLVSTSSFSQVRIGALAYGGNTAINNAANRAGEDIYRHLPTMAGGGGLYASIPFTDKKFGNRMLHGRRLSSFQNKWYLRTGFMYTVHNQKYRSEYVFDGEDVFQTGTKRLDYLKFFVHLKHTYPFLHLKKMNVFWYGGLQGAYLTDQGGGIVTWREFDNFTYYDQPPADRGYYKDFVAEIAVGGGVEYHLTKWINITGGLHFDWSITTVENNDVLLYNNDPNHAENGEDLAVGVYDRTSNRGDSRLSTAFLMLGIEYTLHRPEHARAKF